MAEVVKHHKRTEKNIPGGPVPNHLGECLKLHSEHSLRVNTLAL
jgi:hypothetical protein